jgi:hypothetical protein
MGAAVAPISGMDRKSASDPNKKGAPQQHEHSGGRSCEGPTDEDELIDEASKESFPTSDPPSYMPRPSKK